MTSLLHIVAGLAQATLLDVHPPGNLFDTADATDEVVEHGAEHIAEGAAEDGEDRIHAGGGKQGAHHHFGTEGDESACEEGCHCHPEVAVFYEKLIERIQVKVESLEFRV